MKSIRFFGPVFLLLAVMLISLTGCLQTDTSPSAASETTALTQPAFDPEVIYDQAAQEISQAAGLSVKIELNTTININNQAFTTKSSQTLSYTGLGSSQMLATATETLTVGDHEVEIVDYYGNFTGYTSIDGIGFSSEMSDTAFLSRYLPAALLDASLYSTIQAEMAEGKTVILFSDATAPESWACNAAVQPGEVSGTAVLDPNGHLEECNYNFQGTFGNATISVSAVVTIQTTSIKPAILPEDLSEYTAIMYLDGPKLLEKATGYLLQSKSITATNTQNIQSQAFMLSRILTTQLDMHQEGGRHSSRRSTTVTSSNTGPEDSAIKYQQEELYTDGRYVLVIDGQTPKVDDSITAESMHSYCQDLLVSTVLMPQYITGASYTEDSGLITVHFTANDALAMILSEQACDTLYDDPGLLTSLASGYETTLMEAYLTLDAVTGLPTASGINYSGVHTIDEFAYSLLFEQDQSYVLASSSAKDTIIALNLSTDTATEPTASAETTVQTDPTVTNPA